ncbi:carbonic anhydrase [Chloroflexota bacterium]
MEQHAAFATAINCMDGRVQVPVNEWMRSRYGVAYVDTVTEPGPIKILAELQPDSAVESIKQRTDISVHKHGSSVIAVVAHYDCAGNPVDKDTQMGQLALSIAQVKAWGYDVPIIGLWVDEEWVAHLVRDE